MRKKDDVSWVVYQMTLKGQPSGMNAVCEQGEWDDMEQDRPGYHTLVRAGIENECEAEKLARAHRGTQSPGELRRFPSPLGRRRLLQPGFDTRRFVSAHPRLFSADRMRAYPVSPWVNDPKHEGTRCFEPAA